MNHPGVVHGNWRWQFTRGQLTDGLAARLREQTAAGRRLATNR
jgi:4-alpha-glucanotransferase